MGMNLCNTSYIGEVKMLITPVIIIGVSYNYHCKLSYRVLKIVAGNHCL